VVQTDGVASNQNLVALAVECDFIDDGFRLIVVDVFMFSIEGFGEVLL